MSENEEVIRITAEDVAEANQLSLHCPICAGAVERYASSSEMAPIFCVDCETLYHLACWEQNGGKCAVLGCDNTNYRGFGTLDLGPVMTISRSDILRESHSPRVSPNGSTKRFKQDEQRVHGEATRNVWRDLWQSLLRAIKIWPSDPF